MRTVGGTADHRRNLRSFFAFTFLWCTCHENDVASLFLVKANDLNIFSRRCPHLFVVSFLRERFAVVVLPFRRRPSPDTSRRQLDEEEDNAVTSFFRKGFKNKTWWEEGGEEEKSTNWRS